MNQKATFIRLREDVREMLDKLANDSRISRSRIVEQAIREYCRNQESTSDKVARMIKDAKL
jgi:predicted transcriptional regulator